MRKYHHLLSLGRSKGLFNSNRRWVDQTSRVKSSNYSRISRNMYCIGFNTVSQYAYKATPINPTRYHYHSQLSTVHTLQLPYHEGDYEVIVKSRDVISAAPAPAHDHWLPLSNLDLLLPPIEAGVFFCYRKKDNLSMSPETLVNTLKTSLAGILSTFYPLAGEIVPNSQGEPEVLCNNGGVEFVHAHADVELENLDLHHPDESVKEKLVPRVNRGVLSVQVTELNCGALIVSCAIDHRIADGHSLNMFLVAWAKFSQSKPISNMPSFRPSVLNPRHPPRYDTTFDNLYIPISLLPPLPSFQDQLHSRIYYIRAELINRLQCEANSKETRRSKLLSFTSFLWKLLAHGGNEDVNRNSRMGIVVNGRKFLTRNSEKESSLLENHFGNVLSIPYGVAGNGDLKEMPLNEVANKVHTFVAEATNEEHFRGLIDWVEFHRPEPMLARIYFGVKKFEGEAVVVSSGQGLPVKDMDFGWGKPVFGSYHFPWGGQTGYVTTIPSTKNNGDWIVYLHLKQKDLDLIESMAPHVFTPLTHSYLSF